MDSVKGVNKYSILLPTYNEKDNLPIIIWLILQYMDARLVDLYSCHNIVCIVNPTSGKR